MSSPCARPLRSLLVTVGLVGALAAALPACGAAFESQASVRSLRVLGVRVDPPYGKPGKPVSLEMLYYDGSRRAFLADGSPNPDHKLSIVWLGGCHNPEGDLYYACFPMLQAKLSSLLGAAGGGAQGGPPPKELEEYVQLGPKALFQIPEDAISGRPQAPGAAPYSLSYVFFVACGGELGPAPAGSKTGFPIGCYDPKTKAALGDDDFVIGYTPIYSYVELTNKNPVIAGGTFEKAPHPPVACAADAGCAAGEKCASYGVCVPRVPHCTARKAKDCPTYELKPTLVPADNVEVDVASPPFEGRVPEESIWVAYYATNGTLDEELRLVNDAQKGWQANHETHWSAPNAPAGESRIWAVVHDNRGGTAWWWQDVYID